MREAGRLPGWFRGVFVVVMLLVCALLAFSAVDQTRLKARIADLTLSLETSRGREARQNYEYNEAITALPLAQAELERLEPLAQAAKAEETELRQQRKDIRAENAELARQIADAQAELDALLAQAAELQESAGSLDSILGAP